MLELSHREARRLMIGAQLLAGPVPKRPTKTDMLDVIRQLGAVQIDSISVVQRSHHIVLWSRLGNHPTEWLHELLAEDRAIFEYWTHAAAYSPIELFPYFRRSMLTFFEDGNKYSREWVQENQHVLDHVLEHIRTHGAATTSSFEPPEGAERAEPWAWYGNKPTNLALDILWTAGALMIARRDKFQRVYDLTERVHPDWNDNQLPSDDEAKLALGRVALRALGIATPQWLPDYFRRHSARTMIGKREAASVLDTLVEQGHAVRARVKTFDEPLYVSASALEKPYPTSRTTLLSPFDNLIWHRLRTLEMFRFELRLEAYTPRAQRRYGYFSLPILYGDRLVGRLDPKAHRKTGELAVQALHLEPWFVNDNERFYGHLARTLIDFSTFNGTDHITVGFCDPPHARERLQQALAEMGH